MSKENFNEAFWLEAYWALVKAELQTELEENTHLGEEYDDSHMGEDERKAYWSYRKVYIMALRKAFWAFFLAELKAQGKNQN